MTMRKTLFMAGILAALAGTAAAADYTVTSILDSGVGSLREAITTPGVTDIYFDPSLVSGGPATIALTTKDPNTPTSAFYVTSALNIHGLADITIQGNNTFRLFTVTNADLTISDLAISNFTAKGGNGGAVSAAPGAGGGLGAGGAIFFDGGPSNVLTVSGVAFSSNTATGGNGGQGGGGSTALKTGPGGGGMGGNGVSAMYGAGGAANDPSGLGAGGNSDTAGRWGGGGGSPYCGGAKTGKAGGFGGGGSGGSKTSGFGGAAGFGGGAGGRASSNHGGGGGGGGMGGAIFVRGGTANISSTTFDSSTANGGLTGGYVNGTDGSGFGGAVYVNKGATLSVTDGGMSGGTVTSGATGSALGSAIFLGGNTNYTVTSGTVTIADTLGGVNNATYVNGALNKLGDGTLELTGANTYIGGTTISTGALLANNASGSATGTGNVAVGSGATLGGSGYVGGALSVLAGGHVSPGNSTGILTVNNNVTFAVDSFFDVWLGGTVPGTGYDQLVVSGNVDLGGATLVPTLGYTPAAGDKLFILNNLGSNPITNTFAGLADGDTVTLGAYTAKISYQADVDLGTETGGYDVALWDFHGGLANLTINKFFDVDKDGVYDAGDVDKMLAGWQFEVKDPNGEVVGTYTTDAGGQIVLTDLTAGNYTITETAKKDHVVTGDGSPRIVTMAGGENEAWFGNWLVADVNQDGIVDSQDFSRLKANFGKDPSLWTDGNINGDTLVDSQDFSLLKANFGKGVAPGSPGGWPVPEPATLSLLAMGLLGVLRRRRA